MFVAPAQCRRLNVIAAVCCAWTLLLTTVVGAQTSSSFAFVRTKRLLDEAPQMQAARVRVETEFKKAQLDLAQLQTSLDGLKRRRKQEIDLLSASDAESLEREIAATERKLSRDRDALRSGLTNRQNQLVDEVERSIAAAMADLARERGIEIVVSDEVVMYGNPRLDLTDAVLERLRKMPNNE